MTIDIDAIRRREQAATRGPWATGVRWEDPCDIYWLPINSPSTNEDHPHQPDRVALIRYETCGFQYPHADAKADAEFIAHARQDITDLLAELDRVRAVEMETLRAELAAAKAEHEVHNSACAEEKEDLRAQLRAQLASLLPLRAELAKARRERDEYAADNTRVAVSLVDVQRQLTAANHHTDGLAADVRDMQKANTAYANENARLRSKLADLEDVGRCDHDAGLDVECRPCLVETYGQREAEVAQ